MKTPLKIAPTESSKTFVKLLNPVELVAIVFRNPTGYPRKVRSGK